MDGIKLGYAPFVCCNLLSPKNEPAAAKVTTTNKVQMSCFCIHMQQQVSQ